MTSVTHCHVSVLLGPDNERSLYSSDEKFLSDNPKDRYYYSDFADDEPKT